VWGLCEGETFPFLRWLPDRPTCTEPAPAVVLPPELEGLINAPVATTPSTVAPTTEPPVTAPSTTAPEPVSAVVEDTQVVLGGADFTVRLGTNCLTTCEAAVRDDGQPVLTLVPSGNVELAGDGYQPGSSVEVWLFSDPVRLGVLTVDNDGSFSGTAPVGAAVPGEHTLRLLGTGADGQPRTVEVAVIVTTESAPVPGPGELPSTGTSATPLLLGTAVLLFGLGLITTGRRRIMR
jgi:LPXTG-motif cell wall-anchored protein